MKWVLVVVTLFLAITAAGQDRDALKESSRRAAQECLREKLKVPIDALPSAVPEQSASHTTQKAGTVARDGEVVVSALSVPESELHAVVNPVDPSNIVVSPIRQGGTTDPLICPVYYTHDFGETWQTSAFRAIPAEQNATVVGGGDPVLAFDADGTVYLTWIHLYLVNSSLPLKLGLYWAYSTDGGAHWQRSGADRIASLTISNPQNIDEFYDKQWLAVDRSSSPWKNTVYAAFFHPSPTGLAIAVRKKRSADTAFTTTDAVVAGPGFVNLQFCSIDADAEGIVHVSFFGSTDNSNYALWYARSTDGGGSFSGPVKVSDIVFPRFSSVDRNGSVNGMSTQRIYPAPHIVADKSAGGTRGNLYMSWAASGITAKEANGLDVFVARSTDGGAIWSTPLRVNDDPAGIVRDQIHPSIAVNANGIVAVTWYDRRADPANMRAQLMMALSSDGGQSFGANHPVASASMDIGKSGSRNNQFTIGEYIQVVMSGNYVIPFWSDGRSDDGNINVYGAFINLNTLSVERVSGLVPGMRLKQNYPNPFNPSTVIEYSLEEPASVRLVVHDALGRPVRVLVDEPQQAGSYHVNFAADQLPGGVYYYTLHTTYGSQTRAMQLMK